MHLLSHQNRLFLFLLLRRLGIEYKCMLMVIKSRKEFFLSIFSLNLANSGEKAGVGWQNELFEL